MPHDRALLPSRQHAYPGLPALSEGVLHVRRERVFLVFAGLFLGTLAMLNILGITRFVVFASWTQDGLTWGEWGPPGSVAFAVAVGVLPYPLTFLCTDFISELFGRRRANLVVWVGLLLNLLVIGVLWFASILPTEIPQVDYGLDTLGRPVTAPPLPEPVYDEAGRFVRFSDDWTFGRLRQLAFGAVTASMVAYLAAQFVDVYLFHFWKWLTKGRHLWLRNNGSTMISQLVDTVAVILITHFYAKALPVDPEREIWPQLLVFIATGYAFKFVAALLDTIPFYVLTPRLCRYLRLPPPHLHHAASPEPREAEAE